MHSWVFTDGIFAVAYSYIVAAIIMPRLDVFGQHRAAGASLKAVPAFGSWARCDLVRCGRFRRPSSDTKFLLKPIPLGPYFAIGTLLVVLERVLS